jgi:NAD(P)-dependent dehydrogenase (short-subunit alcohol dehydrogenase family)
MSLPDVPSLALRGKSVLVTGAAGGIGAAVATLFAAAGAAVALCDRDQEALRLEAIATVIRAAGAKALPLIADVSDRASMFAVARRAATAFGDVDILVACAGVYPAAARVTDIDEAAWDMVQGVNLKGVLFACQAVLPAMTGSSKGSIVTTLSDSAFDVIPGEAAYGISKTAGARLTAYLAREIAGSGVRANAIAPGYVRTAMTEAVWRDPVAYAAAVDGIPLRRFAEPLDIAHVALFLNTTLGAYVNGQCPVVDGGRIAGRPS